MIYDKRLPNLGELARLSMFAGSFPKSRAEIVRIARRHRMSPEITNFLCSFPDDTVFQSYADFILRCEERGLLQGPQYRTSRPRRA